MNRQAGLVEDDLFQREGRCGILSLNSLSLDVLGILLEGGQGHRQLRNLSLRHFVIPRRLGLPVLELLVILHHLCGQLTTVQDLVECRDILQRRFGHDETYSVVVFFGNFGENLNAPVLGKLHQQRFFIGSGAFSNLSTRGGFLG